MQLYLIRHPQPSNVAGLCYGRQHVPVDAESVARAALAVREGIPERVLRCAGIFSSPSQRCMVLARALASCPTNNLLAAPREPTVVDELQEMSFGAWEGRDWEAVPRDELDAWAADVWGYRPGGAESAAMVADRWRRWSTVIRRTMNVSVVAVTHAGVIRVALACAGLLDPATFLTSAIGFGSVYRVDVEKGEL
jgi:alpha-ribazole phosphatase